MAAISEPIEQTGQPCSTVTMRFVFFTDSMMVALSSGRSVRRSMISASMPSFASASAASMHMPTEMECDTSVTCAPSRTTRALPIGSTKSSSFGTGNERP